MGVIDGTTALGGADIASGELSSPRWGPSRFEAYQLKDYLDLRAYYSSGATRSVMRLLSNADVHFYGELVLHNGAMRSFNTMSVHCLDGAQDIASFRTGSAPGSEVLRVEKDGTVTGNKTAVRIKNSAVGDGEVVQFLKSTTLVATLGTDSAGGYLKSGANSFYLRTSSGVKRYMFGFNGTQFHLFDSDGDIGIAITAPDSDYAFIRVGGAKAGASSRQGRVYIDRNGSENAAVGGWLILLDKNGVNNYLWVDTSGKLRITRSLEPTSDTDGTGAASKLITPFCGWWPSVATATA